GHGSKVQLHVAGNVMDQRLRRHGVVGADEHTTQRVWAVVVAGDLMQVTEYLTVESRLPAVQHPHHFPLPTRKRDSTTEPQPWIAHANGFPHSPLALAWRENATGPELDMVTHLNPRRCQTADRHVHAIGRINARQIDHLHQLERGRWLAVVERCNAT